MKALGMMAALLVLAACATDGATSRPPIAAGRAPLPVETAPGLDRVMGQDAASLTRLFGPADAEVREGGARKLQFAGPICVLDAYLYPESGREPRVTWLDVRQPEGGPIDKASCVAALTRRSAAK